MIQSPTEIVVIAADKDKDAGALTALRRHVKTLPAVSMWHRSDVPAGWSIKMEQQARMSRAQIFIVLLSADLLAGHPDELETARVAHEQGRAKIIPVLLRPVLLPGWLLDLGVLPGEADPIMGREAAWRDDAWVQVVTAVQRASTSAQAEARSPQPPSPGMNEAPVTTILIMASDPGDQFRLATADEVHEIERCLQVSKHRDRFRLVQKHATTRGELLQIMLDVEPTILHFCGHGKKQGIVLKEAFTGKSALVKGTALASLFAALDDKRPRLVMLNACYSEEQSGVLCQEVDCVVGISGVVDDRTAIAFSSGFYLSLFSGKSVHAAAQLAMANAEIHESDKARILHLQSRQGVAPQSVRFV